MKWETIYNQNKNRKFQEIKEISSNFTIKSNIKNLSKKQKKALILIIVTLSIFMIITFHSSIKSMIYTFLLFFIIAIFSLFFNSYSIDVKEGNVIVKTGGQEIKIPKGKLKNIYIEENVERIFLKKVKGYNLVLLYETPNKNIFDIVLTTNMLSKKQLQQGFNSIILQPRKVNYQEKCIQYKKKRFLKKVLFYGICILITFIFIMFHFFTK